MTYNIMKYNSYSSESIKDQNDLNRYDCGDSSLISRVESISSIDTVSRDTFLNFSNFSGKTIVLLHKYRSDLFSNRLINQWFSINTTCCVFILEIIAQCAFCQLRVITFSESTDFPTQSKPELVATEPKNRVVLVQKRTRRHARNERDCFLRRTRSGQIYGRYPMWPFLGSSVCLILLFLSTHKKHFFPD